MAKSPRAVSHTYHTTQAGHQIKLDLLDGEKDGPVLLSFHGGGIISGCRTDMYLPAPILDGWPGPHVMADYRLLLPSSGLDIVEDMTALLNFLPTILTPSQLANILVAGFSGGGYPARLVAVIAGQNKDPAANTVRGVVAFFGMGGDFLLDYWLHPQTPFKTRLEETQRRLAGAVEPFRRGPECSEGSYEDSDMPSRISIWEYFHAHGNLPDLISGIEGLSDQLRGVPREQREVLIPESVRIAFPQIYISEHPSELPPTLLLHGSADSGVPIDESVHTCESIKRGGGEVEIKIVEGGDHSLAVEGVWGKETMEAYQYTLDWMLARAK